MNVMVNDKRDTNLYPLTYEIVGSRNRTNWDYEPEFWVSTAALHTRYPIVPVRLL